MKKKLLFILLLLVSFNTASPGIFDRFKRWVASLREKTLPEPVQIALIKTRIKGLLADIERIKGEINSEYQDLIADLEAKEQTTIAEALKAAYSVSVEDRWKKNLEEGQEIIDDVLQKMDVADYQMSHARIKYDQAKQNHDKAIKLQKDAKAFFDKYRKMSIQDENIKRLSEEGKKATEEITREEEEKKAAEEIDEEKKAAEDLPEETKEPEVPEEPPVEEVMAGETMLEKLKAAWNKLPDFFRRMKVLDQKAEKLKKQETRDSLKPLFEEYNGINAEFKTLNPRLKKEKVPEDEIQKFIDRINLLGDNVDEVESAF